MDLPIVEGVSLHDVLSWKSKGSFAASNSLAASAAHLRDIQLPEGFQIVYRPKSSEEFSIDSKETLKDILDKNTQLKQQLKRLKETPSPLPSTRNGFVEAQTLSGVLNGSQGSLFVNYFSQDVLVMIAGDRGSVGESAANTTWQTVAPNDGFMFFRSDIQAITVRLAKYFKYTPAPPTPTGVTIPNAGAGEYDSPYQHRDTATVVAPISFVSFHQPGVILCLALDKEIGSSLSVIQQASFDTSDSTVLDFLGGLKQTDVSKLPITQAGGTSGIFYHQSDLLIAGLQKAYNVKPRDNAVSVTGTHIDLPTGHAFKPGTVIPLVDDTIQTVPQKFDKLTEALLSNQNAPINIEMWTTASSAKPNSAVKQNVTLAAEWYRFCTQARFVLEGGQGSNTGPVANIVDDFSKVAESSRIMLRTDLQVFIKKLYQQDCFLNSNEQTRGLLDILGNILSNPLMETIMGPVSGLLGSVPVVGPALQTVLPALPSILQAILAHFNSSSRAFEQLDRTMKNKDGRLMLMQKSRFTSDPMVQTMAYQSLQQLLPSQGKQWLSQVQPSSSQIRSLVNSILGAVETADSYANTADGTSQTFCPPCNLSSSSGQSLVPQNVFNIQMIEPLINITLDQYKGMKSNMNKIEKALAVVESQSLNSTSRCS